MFYLKKFFFFCLFLPFNLLIGQDYAFQQFTINDGLPSSYLYDIIQDENGSFWITSEAGLCLFDGSHFVPTKIEGLDKNQIINLEPGSDGGIWFFALSSDISFLKNGELKHYGKIANNYSFCHIYEDFEGNYWFSNQTGLAQVRNNIQTPDSIGFIYHNESIIEGNSVFIPSDKDVRLLQKNGLAIYDGKEWTFQPFDEGEFLNGGSKFIIPYQDYFIVCNGRNLFKYDPITNQITIAFPEHSHFFKSGINYLTTDKKGILWVSTRDGLIQIYKDKHDQIKVTKHLDEIFVGVILQDYESNYWITTQRDGLFFLPTTEIEIYRDPVLKNQISVVIQNNEGETIIGYDDNWLLALDQNNKVIRQKKLLQAHSEIYDIIIDQNGLLNVATSDSLIVLDNEFNVQKFEIGSYKVIEETSSGNLWFGRDKDAGYFEQDSMIVKLSIRSYSLFKDEDNMWIGTVDGLYYCDKDCNKFNLEGATLDIRDMIVEDSLLYLASNGNGLFIYNLNTKKIVKNYNVENGLTSNNCKKIIKDEQYIWLATNNGINKINRKTDQVQLINNYEGLPSNEINNLFKNNDEIFAATNNGIARFNKNLKVESSVPNLQITKIKINERDTILLNKYKLKATENNVKINFNAIAFKHANKMVYAYKMKNVDDDWIYSSINRASYPSLPSGNYLFEVKSKTINSNWSKTARIEFKIETPYYKTSLFYLIILGLLLLATYFLFKNTQNYYKHQNDVQERLRKSELTALRAQMNPHFMFNALNSIQEFIIKEDKRSANFYLTRFSKLMRQILNNSDKNVISLKNELDSLNLYLSLEALRFEDHFEYNINIDDSIDTGLIKIPSMLVQPYVENAIKHGLLHQKGNKLLDISFSIKNQHLICEVLDNGIGRKQSAIIHKNNKRLYPSKAMSLTKERLNLLNATLNNKLSVDVIDLTNEKNASIGTKVIINIPII